MAHALEELARSPDPRVRALTHAAVLSHNHVRDVGKQLEHQKDLRKRAALRAACDENAFRHDAFVAGAVALEGIHLALGLRIVVARLVEHGGAILEHRLGEQLRAFADRRDPGNLVLCPACQLPDASSPAVDTRLARTCLVCEGSGQANEAVVELWAALEQVLRPVIGLTAAEEVARAREHEDRLDACLTRVRLALDAADGRDDIVDCTPENPAGRVLSLEERIARLAARAGGDGR